MNGRVLPVVFNDRESETRTPSQPLIVIPRDAQDPFNPMPLLPAIHPYEADLTRIAPNRPLASGERIEVTGRILDEDQKPVRRVLIELWNANTFGRYSHTRDDSNTAPLDPHFYGFGRVLTDDDGMYRFRTIKPGAYIARSDIGWWRPPHVHFSIVGGGVRLVTQMYFPHEPLNDRDFIHMVITEEARHRVIARPGENHSYRFDITVRGRHQTPFEAASPQLF
jgi:protocatechuate 3,4-dioxygenase, beta subunit